MTNANCAHFKQIYLLKYFVFLRCLIGNGAVLISSRIPGPMSPHTWAHEPGYAGRNNDGEIKRKMLIYGALQVEQIKDVYLLDW